MRLFEREGADPYVAGHGDLTYDVSHYDLRLTYDVRSNHLDGDAELSVVALEPLDRFSIDLQGLTVSKLSVDGVAARHHVRRRHVEVRTDRVLEAGEALTVRVRYSGTPGPVSAPSLGRAGWEELSDGVIVAGQPHGAPSWFPCNDRPSSKATYRLAVTAPHGYHVVANGLLTQRKRRSSTTRWTYEQDQPMAPYLATVQIGDYEVLDLGDSPVPVSLVIPRRLLGRHEGAFADQVAMLETFSRLFGDYPFDCYTVVVTDDDLEIPLESQGLSTFGANHLTADWDTVRLVAHELSHQWFGNSLTAGAWRDIWLHEGFACYAEWLWSEHSGGPAADAHARQQWTRLAALDQDLLLADPGPELMFDDRVYKRGALLLHALRTTVGDDAFFDLLRAWTSQHTHGTVSTEMFVSLAERETGRSLGPLFTAWLREEELPPLPR